MNLTDNRRVFLSNVSHQTPNDGYDLPFADGDLMSAFYVGLVNFILMLCSSAAGIMTIIFSFKYNSDNFFKVAICRPFDCLQSYEGCSLLFNWHQLHNTSNSRECQLPFTAILYHVCFIIQHIWSIASTDECCYRNNGLCVGKLQQTVIHGTRRMFSCRFCAVFFNDFIYHSGCSWSTRTKWVLVSRIDFSKQL